MYGSIKNLVYETKWCHTVSWPQLWNQYETGVCHSQVWKQYETGPTFMNARVVTKTRNEESIIGILKRYETGKTTVHGTRVHIFLAKTTWWLPLHVGECNDELGVWDRYETKLFCDRVWNRYATRAKFHTTGQLWCHTYIYGYVYIYTYIYIYNV